ncbi:unnamed protein product [Schistosoma mattheei]|uniref:Uncharacterized protein n=1 Tax=Schistosoma mattheei TaxID=31246 RepID=A0A183PN32_9TREM|nr:unnamed protein product [Schistosoma mattheei]
MERMQLNDLDFADDMAFLSHMQQQIYEKTTSVAAVSVAVGINIHKKKSKILRYNTAYNNRITIDGEDLDDVKPFTYLCSISDQHEGSDTDMNAWIGKARVAYLQLKNIWNSKQLSVNCKHQSQNIQYKCQDSSTVWGRNLENHESRHPQDTSVYQQLSTQNTLNPLVRHYQHQSLELERTDEIGVEEEMRKNRWMWMGHTLRKALNCVKMQAITWNPQGGRRIGRLKNTLHREIEINRHKKNEQQLVGTRK